MKKIILPAIAIVFLAACNNSGSSDKNIELANEIDSVSYAIGMNSATGLKENVPEINMEAYIQGFKNQADSGVTKLTTEEMDQVLQAYSMKRQMKQMEEQQKKQEEQFGSIKAEGEKFLEENKQNPDVKVTPSGLQYMVIKEGSGKQPTIDSKVRVHYHGTLLDGSVFDSSVEKGQPIDYPVAGFIQGWQEGLPLMKEGAKYKFFIPQELAYGANPNPQGPIKPYMTLIFEIELIKVLED